MPPTSEEVAMQAQTDYNAEQRRADLEQKLKDGKIQAAASKKDDLMVVGGGGKGKKGKKQKNQQNTGPTTQSNHFEIDFHQIKMFGVVRLSPPLGPQDLDEKIEQLTKKEQEYIEEGEALLKKEKTDLEQLIEKEVDEELERERRVAEYGDEDGYDDEDDLLEDGKDKGGPPKGGNRGRGSRPGDRDRKPNEPKKRRAPRGEFESKDDYEEELQESKIDPYSKPSRGGGQQVNQSKKGKPGKKEMDLDNDEDFPAL